MKSGLAKASARDCHLASFYWLTFPGPGHHILSASVTTAANADEGIFFSRQLHNIKTQFDNNTL